MQENKPCKLIELLFNYTLPNLTYRSSGLGPQRGLKYVNPSLICSPTFRNKEIHFLSSLIVFFLTVSKEKVCPTNLGIVYAKVGRTLKV